MIRDLHNNINVERAISPVSVADTTAQVGEIIDMQGKTALEYVIALGSLADVDATFAVLVEHGEDSALSDAAAVPDKDLLGTEAEAGFQFDDDNAMRKIGYIGAKRYNRITITPAANTSAALFSVAAVSQVEFMPTDNPPT